MRPRSHGLALVVGVLIGGSACVTASMPEPVAAPPELAPGVRAFLHPSLLGFAGNIPEQSRYDLVSASRALERGDSEGARASAEALLAIDPTLLPATVLKAQVHFALGEEERVVELLAGRLAGHVGYTAGQLVYARAAELGGQVVAAYGAYLGIADDASAAERLEALRPRAVAELGATVGDAIRGNRLAEAAAGLDTLATWAPGDPATVDLRRRLAVARGDAAAELGATRELIAAGETSLELLERQAALELENGDARVGLELFERLAERHPGNMEIAASLAAARFLWRTRLLPDDVARLLDASSLLRGDFAALTFWLVPGVRSGRAGSTVIVSDIVEHPQRREIARVLNLGLMTPVDAAVRQFAPNDYMRRGPALATLLRMPSRIGSGAACTGSAEGPADDAPEAVCAAALRCRLISEVDECRPERAISGPEAVEALRRTLHLIQ